MAILRRLHARQLDAQLEPYRELVAQPAPRTGWIREIRRALGMTAKQLGDRMGLAQSAVTSVEQGEARGAITLGSLQKAARALNCDLIYALVPRERLEERLLQRLQEIARQKVGRVSHTMKLENQRVSEDYEKQQIDDLVQQMLVNPPRNLWD